MVKVATLLKQSFFFACGDNGQVGELFLKVKVPLVLRGFEVHCVFEHNLLVHSLLKHHFWVISFKLNLVNPVCISVGARGVQVVVGT